MATKKIITKSPINTRHTLRMQVGPTLQPVEYEIYQAFNLSTSTPNADEPLLFLKVARRYSAQVPAYHALPLTEFLSISVPMSKADVFWKLEVIDGDFGEAVLEPTTEAPKESKPVKSKLLPGQKPPSNVV